MISKPKGISGFTLGKDCLRLDYPIDLAVASLLPVCDEVIIGDMGSVDGTLDMLQEIARREPKVRVVDIHDWTTHRSDKNWWTGALNETREHCKFSTALQLDADEVLSDDAETRRMIEHTRDHANAILLDRLNFARDATSIIPEGECCGRWVMRCGPSHLWWPSDEPHPRGEVHILDMANYAPNTFIFHLGFLRKSEAFYAKAKVVLNAFFGEYDTRLQQAEFEGVAPLSKFPWWNRLTKYNGRYPDSVRKWMTERGYVVP